MDIAFLLSLAAGIFYILFRVARYILPQDIRRARRQDKKQQDAIERAFYSIIENANLRKKPNG